LIQSIPFIQTDRLGLKAISPADGQAIFKVFSDPLVVEYYDIDPITDQQAALRLIEGFAAWFKLGEAIRWGIWHSQTDQLMHLKLAAQSSIWHLPRACTHQ